MLISKPLSKPLKNLNSSIPIPRPFFLSMGMKLEDYSASIRKFAFCSRKSINPRSYAHLLDIVTVLLWLRKNHQQATCLHLILLQLNPGRPAFGAKIAVFIEECCSCLNFAAFFSNLPANHHQFLTGFYWFNDFHGHASQQYHP